MQNNVTLKLLVVALIAAILGAYIMRDRLHAPAAQTVPAMQPYSSEEGISLRYPGDYKLSSSHHVVGAISWDSTDFVSANGAAISLSIFSDAEGLSLENFIKTQPESNYRFSKDKTLTAGTIGGQPAFSYIYSQTDQSDATAILYNHRVYLFSNHWTQTIDPVRRDFGKVLSSVQFQ